MARSTSADNPFIECEAKLRPAQAVARCPEAHAASGAPKTPSSRSLRILLGEPEVRLMMRADGVDELQLLQSLDAVAAWLRREERFAHEFEIVGSERRRS